MNSAASNEPLIAPRRYAIILAGGAGTRLWPSSRFLRPKQLLSLGGKDSLLQRTVRRLLPMVPADHIFVVTGASLRYEVIGQVREVASDAADNVLSEPVGRNTLPAVAWAVARICRVEPRAMVAVFASDHAVGNEDAMLASWQVAEEAANEGYLCLFGIKPREPSSAYGYIEGGSEIGGSAGAPPIHARHVKRFVEKPAPAHARDMVADGGYFWNSGNFVFQASRFSETLSHLMPEVAHLAAELAAGPAAAALDRYALFPDVSVDYGLLEKADRLAVVPVDMGWSDLGNWNALYELQKKDAEDNVTQGDVIALESRGSLAWTEHGLLALYGMDGIAVVQTRDATLICPRDRLEDLKPLVAEVAARHPDLVRSHATVGRPWGTYTVLEEGYGYKIKRIVVNPGARLSMQMHHHRSEHWVVVSGTARITNGDSVMYLEQNQSTYIPRECLHRLENPGEEPLQIIEIQSGEVVSEEDIVRVDDAYGRNCTGPLSLKGDE